MNDEELIERIVALNYREFGANVGNDLKRIIIKKENELERYKNIINELEKYLNEVPNNNADGIQYGRESLAEDLQDLIKELKGE